MVVVRAIGGIYKAYREKRKGGERRRVARREGKLRKWYSREIVAKGMRFGAGIGAYYL